MEIGEFVKTFINEYIARPAKLRFTDILEILFLTYIIYCLLKWIKTTNAWTVVKGLVPVVGFLIIAVLLNFHVVLWILVNMLGVGITAFIIIFQPELRKGLGQLGQRDIFGLGAGGVGGLTDKDIDEMLKGIYEMAEKKTGALIVLEQQVDMQDIIETGIQLDSLISSGLLISIFEDKKPLHDGAVIIRGRRIIAATCYLPRSENRHLSKELGTRHRAGVGISEVTDSFTIIVSEERGEVSIARKGELIRKIEQDYLREQLLGLRKTEEKKKSRFVIGRKEKQR